MHEEEIAFTVHCAQGQGGAKPVLREFIDGTRPAMPSAKADTHAGQAILQQ